VKLLFLANRVPYPPYRGDKLKIFNLAKRLQEHHQLHLLTFAQSKQDLQYKAELEKIFKQVHFIYLPKWMSALKCLAALWSLWPLQVLYFRSAAMRRKVKEVVSDNKFDAVHVQHLRMSPYLAHYKEIPRILDLPDAFSLYWQRRKIIKRNIFSKFFQAIEQSRLLRFEKIIKEYNLSLVCSPEDLDYLRALHKADNLRLLPNGVDLSVFYPRAHDYTHNNTILFTGNMDYAPNIDAVIYFTREIFPLILKTHPEVKFIIAGQRPVAKVKELASQNIIVKGFIQDLAAEYNAASVVVAPLRFGAGTQNKVLEAMAMGMPVVTSNVGFKGLNIETGQGAILSTDTSSFANSVIELLSDVSFRQSVGQKGIAVIQQQFNWDNIAMQLENYFAGII